MSLPSSAIFVDADRNPLAYGFCNIGWFVEEDLLPRTVDEALEHAIALQAKRDKNAIKMMKTDMPHDGWDNFKDFEWDDDWREKWTHARLYGYTVSREFLGESYHLRMEKKGNTIKVL